jgi:hypothetical protein
VDVAVGGDEEGDEHGRVGAAVDVEGRSGDRVEENRREAVPEVSERG